MALVPITTYGAAWNPTTNQGRVFNQIGTGQPTPVGIDDADEFLVTIMMLSKTGVQFDSQTRRSQSRFGPLVPELGRRVRCHQPRVRLV